MKILIVRLGSLGDIVHALPVAAALRERYPGRAHRLAGRCALRGLLDLVPVIDRRFVISTGRQGRERAGRGRRAQVRRPRRGAAGIRCAAVGAVRRGARSAGPDEVRGARAAVRRAAGDWVRAPPPARAGCARRSTPSAATLPRPGHVVTRTSRFCPRSAYIGAPLAFPLAVGESPALDDGARALGGRGARVRADQPRRGVAEQALAAGAVRRGRLPRCGERHGLASVVLWGPGEERLARAVAGASSGRGAASAAHAASADLIGVARGRRPPDDLRRHRAAAPGRGRRHADRRAVRPDRPGAQRPVDRGRHQPLAFCRLRVSLSRGAAAAQRACIEEITVEDVRGAIDRRLALADAAQPDLVGPPGAPARAARVRRRRRRALWLAAPDVALAGARRRRVGAPARRCASGRPGTWRRAAR